VRGVRPKRRDHEYSAFHTWSGCACLLGLLHEPASMEPAIGDFEKWRRDISCWSSLSGSRVPHIRRK